ncbi:MAG: hypothetical protein IAG10_28010 [Planctomycetaceae bacterium]|nr:hypothetical protein [Planctomycetaceae bacterium]
MIVTLCSAAVLTATASTLWFLALAFGAAITGEFVTHHQQVEQRQDVLAIREDGQPLIATNIYARHGGWEYAARELDGRPLEFDQLKLSDRLVTLADLRLAATSKRWAVRERLKSVKVFGTEQWFLHNFGDAGYLEVVSPGRERSLGYFGRKGFVEGKPPREDWFPTRTSDGSSAATSTSDTTLPLPGLPNQNIAAWWNLAQRGLSYQSEHTETGIRFVEPGGRRVHFIEPRTRRGAILEMETEPVQAIGLLWQSDSKTWQIILRTATTLQVCSKGETPQIVRKVTLPEAVRNAAVLQWQPLGNDPLSAGENLFVLCRDSDWRLIWSDDAGRVLRDEVISNAGHLFDAYRSTDNDGSIWSLTLLQTPLIVDVGLWMVAKVEHPWQRELQSNPRRAAELGLFLPQRLVVREFFEQAQWPFLTLHLTGVFWSVLAVRRLKRFQATLAEQSFWAGWTFAFGLPGYLAFRAHRSWESFNRNANGVRGERQPCDAARPDGAGVKRRTPAHTIVAVYAKFLDASERFGAAVATFVGLPAGHTALVIKEWRLTAGAAMLGLLAYLMMVARLAGVAGFGWLRGFISDDRTIPFLRDGFLEPFTVISVLLAVWLAVMQTAFEARHQAWLFALHRPVSRWAILLTKVIVGAGLLLACSAVPIVLYAAWAARPGSQPAPFAWGMTEQAWRWWWGFTPVYLGTLLTMLRPARWLGTRLFPVIAAFGWLPLRDSWGLGYEPIWIEFGLISAIDAILIACLLLVIREREYP